MPVLQQTKCGVRSDVAGAAGDQNLHGHKSMAS
jgi:hypothetical protein